MTVLAHGRDEQRLRALALEVEEATGTSIDTVAADLSDLREVDRLAAGVVETYDRLHVLVNNAGVGFGAPGSGRRSAPTASSADRRGASHQSGEQQVLHDAARRPTCTREPRPAPPLGQQRAATAAATARTAARSAPPRPWLICDRSATSTIARRRRRASQRPRGSRGRAAAPRPQRRWATPAPTSGPGAERSAARSPHIQYAAGPVARDARPSSGSCEHRAAPPTRRSRTARTPAPPPARRPRRPAAAASDRRRRAPPAPAPEQRQAVGHHHARSPSSSPASTDQATAAPASPRPSARRRCPRRPTAANIASAETALPDRGRAEHQERRGPAGQPLGAEHPQRRPAPRPAVVAASSGDHQPGGEAAAEPEPVQRHEEEQRARRVAGDVHRPVAAAGVEGDPADVLLQRRVQVGRTPRAVRRYSYASPEDPRDRRASRRRAPAPASRPARRRTTASSSRRQGSRSARPAACQHGRAAASRTAGTVPGPTRGSHSACSGGNESHAHVPAGIAAGTTIASDHQRATATARPATRRPVPRPGPREPRQRERSTGEGTSGLRNVAARRAA